MSETTCTTYTIKTPGEVIGVPLAPWGLVFCGTLHMCSDGCVLVTVRHGEVLHTVIGSTARPSDQARHTSPVAILTQAHSFNFVPPVPSLLCACLVATDHPRELGAHHVLGSLYLWAVVTATWLVPFVHRGFYP